MYTLFQTSWCIHLLDELCEFNIKRVHFESCRSTCCLFKANLLEMFERKCCTVQKVTDLEFALLWPATGAWVSILYLKFWTWISAFVMHMFTLLWTRVILTHDATFSRKYTDKHTFHTCSIECERLNVIIAFEKLHFLCFDVRPFVGYQMTFQKMFPRWTPCCIYFYALVCLKNNKGHFCIHMW